MTALATVDHDVPDLLRRVAGLLDQGRPGAARPLLNAVLRVAPATPDTMALEARLLWREGRTREALALLDAGIDDFPESLALRLSRTGARIEAADWRGAAADASEAVIINPDLPHAKALLGVALLNLGQAADARACLAEAVRGQPANTGYRLALAQAQEAHGDAVAALGSLYDGIAADPRDAALRTAAMLLHIRLNTPAEAATLGRAAQRIGAADARVFDLLGHACASLGETAAAADAFEEARKLGAVPNGHAA